MRNRELNLEGAGLGLKISQNLAKAMGGSLTVSSRLGEGSTFSIELPLKRHERQESSIPLKSSIIDDVASQYRLGVGCGLKKT